MFRHLANTLAVLGLLASAPIAYSSPVILDTFDSPPGGQSAPSGTPVPGSFPSTPNVGFFNANRTVSWSGTGAASGNFGIAEGVFLNTAPDTFGQLKLSTIGSSVQVNLKYDNFSTIDLSGYSGLELDFSLLDRAGVPFEIELELQTSTGPLNGSLTVPIAPPGPFLAFIPFSTLTGTGNLASVTEIVVKLNASQNQSVDFTLDELRLPIVPEPGTIALFGLGLLGVVGVTLRRKLRAA